LPVSLQVLTATSVINCVLFVSLEISDAQSRPRLFHDFFKCKSLSRFETGEHRHWTSPSIIDKPDQENLYLVPERRRSLLDPEREKELWLQRRNSLSSQRAIYPHNYRTFEARTRMSPGYRRQSSFYSTTSRLRSVSEDSAWMDFTTRSHTLTSSSDSNGSEGSSRSTMRRTSAPDLPALRESESFELEADLPNLPQRPQPAWCPILQHAPLSSDPQIRDLIKPPPPAQQARSVGLSRLALAPRSTNSIITARTPYTPVLPKRAPGHTIAVLPPVARTQIGTGAKLSSPGASSKRYYLHPQQRRRVWRYDSSLSTSASGCSGNRTTSTKNGQSMYSMSTDGSDRTGSSGLRSTSSGSVQRAERVYVYGAGLGPRYGYGQGPGHSVTPSMSASIATSSWTR